MDTKETETPAPSRLTISLDLRTITLGEMAAVELASGEDFGRLWKTRTTRLLAALFIEQVCRRDYSSSEPVPSWSDLSGRRLLGD